MQTCHLQGSGIWNEDALVVNERNQVYGVVDGATSLGGYRDKSSNTGGYIAAQLLAAHAIEAADGMPLEQLVMQANAALGDRMREAGIDMADKAQRWSAAFALFRVREDWIEYVQAGDCMLFAKYKDGTYRRLTHDQVARFDRACCGSVRRRWNWAFANRRRFFAICCRSSARTGSGRIPAADTPC
ncbi:protein phosphatase 2C domain-containing protein [Paenibacillus melissococcoides]|uniref:Protein phosphatase 2C domain-containing protein n=1 Tax=Paenibacillus melissococcoides TaxID=2912268 RepID=A0ABN8TZ69_9BACL|nr:MULTISPECIES: protein phosphatase 2C domain-containing protein [Paenibacillus]MEB9892060.1 protein phosphatase 2C domain-containing protein [Bacillus cereus]CAH8244069.1 protein phosphatase 2C domain-containing protein [Paenibacillus melissococcoides]CAH8703924.1 protein phosphatase 2C domain-containing protein [Paenibacillus melissococcoides]CAH8706545.1 protein phosphatase 2C domain-containing protein [Paenibacillus melissococcoides]GIO82813.1 hypothetical protein J6TS7_64230 [Paenibacill